MSDARPFTHREDGTDQPTWLLDSRWDDVPRLGLDVVVRQYPHVVLLRHTPTMKHWRWAALWPIWPTAQQR